MLNIRSFTTLFLPIIILFCRLCFAQNQTSFSVTKVIIEGARPLSPPETKVKEHVKVNAGVGAKVIDSKVSKEGVSLETLDGEEEVSAKRAESLWELITSRTNYSRAQITIGLKEKLRGKVVRRGWSLEGGVLRDHSKYEFVDNQNTPYDSDDDTKESFKLDKDSYFLKGEYQKKWVKGMLEGDQVQENVISSTEKKGQKTSRRLGAVLKISKFLDPVLYSSINNKKFEKDFKEEVLKSSKTKDIKVGLNLSHEFPYEIQLSGDLYNEEYQREIENMNELAFKRRKARMKISKIVKNSKYLDASVVVGATYIKDSVDSITDDNQNRLSKDLSFSISSSYRYLLGIKVNSRYYELPSTPIQLFGDGVLLKGTNNLPTEKGIRVAAGPWYETNNFIFKATAFYEKSKNIPLQYATSPNTIVTFPVGGIWARGVEISGELEFDSIQIKSSYINQLALNDSEIQWHRGHSIPGRPRHIFNTSLNSSYKMYAGGIQFSYSSEDVYNLTGTWKKNSKVNLQAKLSYNKPSYKISLLANNLLTNKDDLSVKEGQAGVNLTEPQLNAREVMLQLEALL